MESYRKILDAVEHGGRAMLVTRLPKGGGAPEKAVLPPEALGAEASPSVRAVLQRGLPAVVTESGEITLMEPFYPKERMIILGGGHVALPLVEFAARVGFSPVVVDDRPAFASRERFPRAAQVLCDGFDRCFDTLGLTEFDYVVLITRGHRYDAVCLRRLLRRKETVYLGMIGSRRRVAEVKRLLLEEGFDSGRLDRICAPIGLPIGSVTPEEIGISIMAEVIRRKRVDCGESFSVNRSEVDLPVVRTLARQSSVPCAVATIMETKGSAPRGAGAKMIVYPDGRIEGSVGGGCSEADVIRAAIDVIGSGGYRIQQVDLTGDVAEEEGMVCGGVISVLIEDASFPE